MGEIVKMPQLGETVTEGTILRWLVSVGDVVKEGDEVSVKVVGFDRGKVKLSMKQAST